MSSRVLVCYGSRRESNETAGGGARVRDERFLYETAAIYVAGFQDFVPTAVLGGEEGCYSMQDYMQ